MSSCGPDVRDCPGKDAQRALLEKAGLVVSLEDVFLEQAQQQPAGDAQFSTDSTPQAHTVPEDSFLLCAEMSE
jgi:hypothetical protein